MIFKCELILSVEHDPEDHLNPDLLRDKIAERLKGYVIDEDKSSVKMTIEDSGVFNLKAPYVK